jgi:thymidine kinase
MKSRLIVHTGSMMAGKTEALIRDMKRYNYAKKKILLFKPSIDNRFEEECIVSHSGDKLKAIQIKDIGEILAKDQLINYDVVGIEEIQFFDQEETIKVINELLNVGIVVVVAGLDMTFEGKPFGVMPYLMAIANEVHKWTAICTDCGDEAWASYRLTDSKETVQVGASESYTPLCRECFNKRMKINNVTLKVLTKVN